MKKISIITINLNNQEGLKKTINSVIAQTKFDEIEFICIDGGSNDDSLDIIKQNAENFAYYCSEKDTGIYNAMNKGISHATSEYLLFLCSGDYLFNSTVIESIIPNLTEDIVYGDLWLLTNKNAYKYKKYVDIIDEKYFLYESLPHPASFIKRKLFDGTLYNETFKIISDWLFFYEKIIFDKCSYKHINIPISVFNLGGVSSNIKLVKEEQKNSMKYLAKKIQSRLYVTLTTWEKRYNDIDKILTNILSQTILPYKIFLNLAKDELYNISIPQNLKILTEQYPDIIQINWVEHNTKTMKKVFPILDKLKPDDIILNLDDDIILPIDFIETRLIDFISNGMENSISSQPLFKYLGTYFSGCGSLMLRKYLDHYEEFLTDEIIQTYEDDWVYSFLHILNKGKFNICSKYTVQDMEFYNQETSSKNMKLYQTNNTKKILLKRVYDLFWDKNNKELKIIWDK